jgi:hypothetical protein
VFTARYALTPYIKQIRIVFKGLILVGGSVLVLVLALVQCVCVCMCVWKEEDVDQSNRTK